MKFKWYVVPIMMAVLGGGAIIHDHCLKNNPTEPQKFLLSQEQTLFPSPQDYHLKSEEDWRKMLTPDQYYILRKKGTEKPFSSPLDHESRAGTYVTADCDEPVFRSEQKYDSGSGWPSFWAPINPDAIITKKDSSIFPERIEVLSKCGGHLGHVFEDGPAPTGLRYCMNGAALKFIPDV